MKEIRKFIEKHNTLTLATVKKHDVCAAALFYVSVDQGTSLIFVSNPKSEHIKNLNYSQKCAATIQENNLDWENIKGVQIKGNITTAEDKYWENYLTTFEYISKSETLAKAMKKVKLYKLKIDWARFIDNAKGFGNKKEYEYS
ncbi:pyridoxamine 5'-phosphate oxidase family protein [Marine Group III euryarchaeote]|nr:pyridoxamine 5'-phosphate oxidase family protein [Marine Group III euryarchaeote]